MNGLIKKFKRNFRKTITIEFYLSSDKKLLVIYNGHHISFASFWQDVPEAEDICYRIYEEFSFQFPDRFHSSNANSKEWMETFLKFINNHLSEYDNIIDVFIRTSGKIQINLEK